MQLKRYLVAWAVCIACSCAEEQMPAASEVDEHVSLEAVSIPLDDAGIESLLNEIGESTYVLLGEASHGTAEYYDWRAEISKRLIEEKGFDIIAVEGDWPDLYRFDQYIKGETSESGAVGVLRTFDRWPTWMWANEEVAELGEWLREFNATHTEAVSFHGLDVYSLWDSMNETLAFLEREDPEAATLARNALTCFSPYQNKGEFAYGQAKVAGQADCADELAALLSNLEERYTQDAGNDAAFNALQNAWIAFNAERYYVTALRDDAESWNIRDRHMHETIDRLADRHPDAKIIVWAHNTHVGDARATTMKNEGMVNIGQLIREHHSTEGVYVVGFGSHSGSVVAASAWAAATQSMTVPDAKPGSWEALLHSADPSERIVFVERLAGNPEFMRPIGHRAIGVVYDPASEGGNYVPTVLPERYNAFVYIDETHALSPLQTQSGRLRLGARSSGFMKDLALWTDN